MSGKDRDRASIERSSLGMERLVRPTQNLGSGTPTLLIWDLEEGSDTTTDLKDSLPMDQVVCESII